MTSPRALVIRDGERRRIPGREVVRGDLVSLAEGDRVPADGVLLEARELLIDEFAADRRVGAVRKRAAPAAIEQPAPAGRRRPAERVLGLAGGPRVSGVRAFRATGARSEIGRIGKSLALIDTAAPRLRPDGPVGGARFAVVGVSAASAPSSLYGLLRGAWLDAALAGIALGMSMLPEEFPLVLAVFMGWAPGASRGRAC